MIHGVRKKNEPRDGDDKATNSLLSEKMVTGFGQKLLVGRWWPV